MWEMPNSVRTTGVESHGAQVTVYIHSESSSGRSCDLNPPLLSSLGRPRLRNPKLPLLDVV